MFCCFDKFNKAIFFYKIHLSRQVQKFAIFDFEFCVFKFYTPDILSNVERVISSQLAIRGLN